MSHQIDLESFLADHQDDGQFQGSGQFTIEHQKAARKMAKFALPRPTAWVCKFVQAAVAWNVKAITVSQGRTYTVFHFEWPNLSELPTENELVSSILAGGVSDEKPIFSLCMGLRALVEAADLSFLLVLNDGEVEPKPIYAGAHFCEMSETARKSPYFRMNAGLTVTVAHSPPEDVDNGNTRRAHYQAVIVNELDTYCYFCPVPITVDGRRIDDPIRTPGFQASPNFRPLLTGGLTRQPGEMKMQLPQGYQARMMSVYTHPRRARRAYLEPGELSVAVLLGIKLGYPNEGQQTTVYWVRHGVIIDSEELQVNTSRLKCGIYINADNLLLDLTGFKVSAEQAKKKLESYLEPLAQYLGHIPLATFAFSEDRDDYSNDDDEFQVEEDKRVRIKRILWGSGAALGLVLFSPGLGTAAMLGNLIRVYGPGNKERNEAIRIQEQNLASSVERNQSALRDALLFLQPRDAPVP